MTVDVRVATPYWNVEVDPVHHVVRMRRSAEPMRSDHEFEALREKIRAALASVDRAHYGLLVDLRNGPLRSDPEFEVRSRQIQTELFHAFPRVAVLVRTAVGRLQMLRMTREAGLASVVFMDEAEALRHLAVSRSTPPG